MIKITNRDVYGFEAAIRGMRNPMNSWDNSDSCWEFPWIIIGEKDLSLMKKLVKAGSDHSKFMRMINVTCDITAPLYWWKEYDTYKVGTVANSCSTMHKIHDKEFTREDFSTEHLGCLQAGSGAYWDTEEYFAEWLTLLNVCREAFIKTNDKTWWWQMIQLLPTSYNQLRTVQLNYAVLRNMYHARKTHKLDEWREFCEWIETLPYAELIVGGRDEET
jgi:hypothetical protein